MAAAADVPSAVSSPAKPPAASTQNGDSTGTTSQPADSGLQTEAGTSTFSAARQAKLANEQLPEDTSMGSSSDRKASTPMAVPGQRTPDSGIWEHAQAPTVPTEPCQLHVVSKQQLLDTAGGARSTQSSEGGGDCEGTSPKSGSHKSGSVPLLSRMSLTGLTKTSPGVSEYLRRHSTEGVRHKLEQVRAWSTCVS